MKIIKISWEKIGDLIKELAKKIKGDFDGIYAIPRGGLAIGVSLSYKLNLPLLDKPTKNSLVVDDISDTGTTLKGIPNKKIACLHKSTWTKIEPDFFVETKTDKDSWIQYPWEEK